MALLVTHHHPGRLRVRSQAFADETSLAERTRDGLAPIVGVRSVTHDPRTGSLLVQYEPREIDANGILQRIETLAGVEVSSETPRRARERAKQIVDAVRKLDAAVLQLSNGQLDLRMLVPGSLAALGVYSFLKSSHTRIPRWDNLAYWAYAIFIDTHRSTVRQPQ